MQLMIALDGSVRCVYEEAIDLCQLGSTVIHRASHVEPAPEGWYADLSPVQGPQLGPFTLRSEALAAEQQWLLANWLTRSA